MGQGAPHRLEISNHSNALGQFPRIGNYFNYIGYDFLGRSLFLNSLATSDVQAGSARPQLN